ncbi:MAG TPA: ABC transporter ATP-binding protein [Candidatus Solibacter sp.]|nr:ABC transporter ATP-binding protein [Candidatus Solibacter sp.]
MTVESSEVSPLSLDYQSEAGRQPPPNPRGADAAIEMAQVGKRYWKLEDRPTLVRSLLPFNRPVRSELWALRDADLRIEKGEVVGVIGRNGAGKTTLLRLLAGVTRPTEGRIVVNGRVAPLLSLGIGFQREMSGRENVFLNGMLLGLTQQELRQRFDDIVAFAELGDFIDVPVKFYSSGMYVRLGFAIAVHTEPRVLLVDEVLSVGDSAFQVKCLQRLDEIRRTGATVLMVSHQIAAIHYLCPRSIVIRKGRVEFDGPTDDAVALHHEMLSVDADADASGEGGAPSDSHDPQFIGGASIVGRTLLRDGREVRTVKPNDRLKYRIRIRFERPVEDPGFQFRLVGPDGRWIYARHTPLGLKHRSIRAGEEVEVELEFSARLGHGTHLLQCVVITPDARGTFATDVEGLHFFVEPLVDRWGSVELDGDISVDGIPVASLPQADRPDSPASEVTATTV